MIIYKQVLDFRSENMQTIELPPVSEIISCDFQGENLCLWYSFSPVEGEIMEKRNILMLRTGESFTSHEGYIKFIGTAHDRGQLPFVIHLYEFFYYNGKP